MPPERRPAQSGSQSVLTPSWHTLSVADVLARLTTRNTGLAGDEAAQRLHVHGPKPSSVQLGMAGRECYHCKQWIEEGETHDCWTTTEAALTADLSEDLQDAWERLRETAAGFGEQRIYASHKSIMFSRRSCYFFVRPKKSVLEVCVFLGRALRAPQVRRVDRTSKTKVAHILHVRHRDEVEAPFTDWLHEAYEFNNAPAAKPPGAGAKRKPARKKPTPKKKPALKAGPRRGSSKKR